MSTRLLAFSSCRTAPAVLLTLAAIGCSDRGNTLDAPDARIVFDDAGMVERDAGPSFPDSGIGTNDLDIARVVPGNGPFSGGARAVVRGAGFTADAVVTVGGRLVQPADTDLIDSRRLSIVVPAGEVGPADVTVTVGDDTATLAGGYVYDAIVVDPPSGSIAGGTRVRITGAGTAFAEGDSVLFGRTPCTGVEIVSTTQLTCRTPPSAPGNVDVTVMSAGGAAPIVAEEAFSYYNTSDPVGGGLGGGPLAGTVNVTVLNAMTGGPVPDAFAIVGEDLDTPHQGLSDMLGQVTFSGEDLVAPVTVHVAKHCFEKTSVVAFDASDVTVFLVPWMDPMCGMGGEPGGGRGRRGSYVSGELVWLGPNEYGPNPWANIPDPRAGEVKVAYVYGTQRAVGAANPDPASGGGINRVLESPTGELGYPYRIFVRPSAMAVYALAGLENLETGEFLPYVMGVARNVLVGPGEEATRTNIVMNIPLDRVLDVSLRELPAAVDSPDTFVVTANIDLGGEGFIVRTINDTPIDVLQRRSGSQPFRFFAQPALFGALSDGRYRLDAGWYSTEFLLDPYTTTTRYGVSEVSEEVILDGFLGIPDNVAPADGGRLPGDRILRWQADGAPADLHIVLLQGSDGNPAWRMFVPGNVLEAPIPDLSTIPEISDIPNGFMFWSVIAVRIPGFDFNQFRYTDLSDQYWTHVAQNSFFAQR